MSIFVSAILSDLTGRSISFLIDKIRRPSTAPTVEETLKSLQRLLLRAQVVVEEAEGRLVVNQAMLQLLNRLREEMYRGHHKLDTYICRTDDDHAKGRNQAVSLSFTPSSFKPAKRFRFCSGCGSSSRSNEQELINQSLASLEIAIRDASELAVFLSGCPRLYKQPYSMYLLLDNCMFGRQIEMEWIMNFLLQEEAPGAEYPCVLPIIGPGKVGKTTMIEYACNDDRVRNRFSQIICFSQDSIKDGKGLVNLSDCDVMKHHNCTIEQERVLVVIELAGEIDEGAWREFYFDCKHHLASGSKIIIASRSEAIARFGTTRALRVQFFAEEAYWYFFKVRTFGSTNTEDHPELASLALEMAREMNGSFFSAHIYRGLLKANFNLHFWSMALALVKEFKRMNPFLFGSNYVDPCQFLEAVYLKTNSSEYLAILDEYQTGSAQNPAQSGAPVFNIQDLLFGGVRPRGPRGKFKVLGLRSHLPPHYSYMLNCELWKPQQGMVSRKKKFEEIVGCSSCYLSI